MSVGTDITLIKENYKKYFVDTETGKRMKLKSINIILNY